jgi:hypothetical protein
MHAHGMAGFLLYSFIAPQRLVLAIFSIKVLFIAKAAPRATGEVMTLLPHDAGTCSLCTIKGDDITFSHS